MATQSVQTILKSQSVSLTKLKRTSNMMPWRSSIVSNPYVENDLGMNAFEICDEAGPFPSVRKVLEEHDRR